MKAITRLGDASSWIFLSLVLCLSGAGGTARLGLLVGAGAGIAAGVTQVVKRVSRRRRPDEGIAGFRALVMNPDAFSFPSGHTAAAFGVSVAVIGQAELLGPLFAVLALGIGFSRVYLGAHYPLDVAAGAAIGVASGLGAQEVVASLPM